VIVELGVVGAVAAAGFLGVSGKLAHQAVSGFALIAVASLLFGLLEGTPWASAIFLAALALGSGVGLCVQRDVETAEALSQEQPR